MNQLTELVHGFVKALTLQRLYGAGHPRVEEACQQVLTLLHQAAAGSEELTLGIAKDRLLVGQQSLAAAGDAKLAKFVSYFHHLGVSHLRLLTSLKPEELGCFFEILAREGANGPEAIQHSLRAASVLGITLGLLDYGKAAAERGTDAQQKRSTQEAIWRRLVLPACQAGRGGFTTAERSELLQLVEEPELLRGLLERLERLPRRPAGAAGKAEVADFAHHLARLLKALSADRRRAFIDRLADIIAKSGPGAKPRAAGGPRANQAQEVMAAALATEGKSSERLRTTYSKVLAQAASGKSAGVADVGATASDYLEELLLNRSEAPHMSDGYAQELEGLSGKGAQELEEDGVPAELAETLESGRLALERAHLSVELLKGAGSEADIQALMAPLAQTVASLLKEGSFEEAGELLEAVCRGFYAAPERTRIQRVIADEALGPLEVAPLLDHLLSGRPHQVSRERLAAICRLFALKAIPHLLEKLGAVGPGVAMLIADTLAAMGRAIIPELSARLSGASGDHLLRLIALLGAVGGEAEVAVLEPMVRRWSEAVRKEAVKALGRIGSPQAIVALERVLLTWQWPWGQTEVKLEAARALSNISSEDALEALAQAAQRHGAVAKACEEILARRRRAAA